MYGLNDQFYVSEFDLFYQLFVLGLWQKYLGESDFRKDSLFCLVGPSWWGQLILVGGA